jgi:hypothetical protein
MTSYKDAFVKATELGKVQAGRFYDDVTDAYLKKYGYKMTYGDNLREDQNVASDVDEDEDPDSVPTEMGEARATYCAQLRSVSVLRYALGR